MRSRLRAIRFELFVCGLATVEVLSVVTGRSTSATEAGVTAASALVLLGKRFRPLVSCVLAFALLTLEVAVSPHATLAQFAGVLVTFAVTGAVNTERDALIGWGAGVGTLAYAAWGDPFGGGLGDFLLSTAFGTALWGAGLLVARRGRHATTMALRAEAAERARERAVADERARIARELHDVVSHGLTVTVVQAVAARGAASVGDIDDVERRLDAIESSARDALAEMRRMLELLDVSGNAAGPDRTPGLADLPALLQRTTAAGVDVVAADVAVQPGELAAGVELAVYRVVQESLTNVVKHAPGARANVSVGRCEDGVVVAVDSTAGRARHLPAPSGGRGLVGMRQRVALYDGTVTAGPRPDGGYSVRATLAVPRTDG